MVGDRRVLSLAPRHLSNMLLSIGDVPRALPLVEEALAVSREEGSKREIAWNLGALGATLASAGQWEAVESPLMESIVVGRQSGDITPVLASSRSLARLYLMRGDLAGARRTVDEALALAGQDLRLPIHTDLLITLGDLASADQDWDGAGDWYRQALSAASLVATRGIIAHALRHYAAMCGMCGALRLAVRIFGATSPIHGFSATMFDLAAAEDHVLVAARRALGEDEFAVAWAEGQSITLEQATAEVLSEDSKKIQR